MGAFAGPVLPSAANVTDRSTDEACIVQVPGTGWLGSGHWVVIAEFTFDFHASGMAPKNLINTSPKRLPHSSPRRPPLGHGMASSGFWSWSTENMGTRTYRCAVFS